MNEDHMKTRQDTNYKGTKIFEKFVIKLGPVPKTEVQKVETFC